MSIAFELTPEGQAWNDYDAVHQTPITPEKMAQFAFNSKMIVISGSILFIVLLTFLIFMIIKVKQGMLFTLNGKVKRIGFIIMLIGYVSFSFGLIVAVMRLDRLSKNYVLTDIFSSIGHSIKFTNYHDTNIFLGYGFYILISGIFMIFLYDKTIVKLINWIKSPR